MEAPAATRRNSDLHQASISRNTADLHDGRRCVLRGHDCAPVQATISIKILFCSQRFTADAKAGARYGCGKLSTPK